MKTLQFTLDGTAYSVSLGTKIDKRALYGYARPVAEKDGVVLERGVLCADGRLLKRAQVSNVKLDPLGSPVEPTVTEIDGEAAELLPSSFERDTPLEPLPMTALVGFATTDVYPLEDVGLPPGLYATEFSYRKAVQYRDALLLVKPEEAYLLVGAQKVSAFVGLHVAYEFFDAEEAESDEADELDFAMV